MLLRSKRRGFGTHFGNDLLRRSHLDRAPRASRCTASWCWMRRLAISCSSLTICCSRNCNSSTTNLQEPAVHRVDSVQALSASHNCAGVARNFLSAKAARDLGLVSPSASACSIRRALRPSRSETRLDNLIWVSYSRLSSRFCNCTRSRVIWYFLRITVRHSRCSVSGHKAQGQLLGHEPLHQSLCIGKVFLPTPRPAIRLRLCQMQRS